MIHVVVECAYDTPFDKKAWLEKDLNLLHCLEAHGATWVRSHVSADRRRTICKFEASDAESVRVAHNKMGGSYHRVRVADAIAPGVNFTEWVKTPHSSAGV